MRSVTCSLVYSNATIRRQAFAKLQCVTSRTISLNVKNSITDKRALPLKLSSRSKRTTEQLSTGPHHTAQIHIYHYHTGPFQWLSCDFIPFLHSKTRQDKTTRGHGRIHPSPQNLHSIPTISAKICFHSIPSLLV